MKSIEQNDSTFIGNKRNPDSEIIPKIKPKFAITRLKTLFKLLYSYTKTIQIECTISNKEIKTPTNIEAIKTSFIALESFFQNNIQFTDDAIDFLAFENQIQKDDFYNCVCYLINQIYISKKYENEILQLVDEQVKKNEVSDKQKASLILLMKHVYSFHLYLSKFDFKDLVTQMTNKGTVVEDLFLRALGSYKEIPSCLYQLIKKQTRLFPLHKDKLFLKGTIKWKDLINIAKSEVAIEAYYLFAKEQNLFGLNKNIEQTNEEKLNTIKDIKEEIDRILIEYSFYKVEMSEMQDVVSELTCLNKNIILNAKLYDKRLFKEICQDACILLCILNAISQVMIKTKGAKSNNYFNQCIEINQLSEEIKNFINKKEETKEENSSLIIEDKSEYLFKKLLLNDIWSFNFELSSKLLNPNSWKGDLHEFKNDNIKLSNIEGPYFNLYEVIKGKSNIGDGIIKNQKGQNDDSIEIDKIIQEQINTYKNI